jgi:hypothetical protein
VRRLFAERAVGERSEMPALRLGRQGCRCSFASKATLLAEVGWVCRAGVEVFAS